MYIVFSVKVEAIFRVSRHDEEKRLQGCELNNHMLLFHGTSTSNLLSILKQGLKVAPPEAPTVGYAFGKVCDKARKEGNVWKFVT